MALSPEALALLAMLTLSPGPDTILTLRQSLAAGAGAGTWTAAGISTGTVVHATLSGAGLAVLLQRAPPTFNAVRALGVAYLCFLGLRSLWSAWRGPDAPAPTSRAGGYRDGLAANLLNPKVALFYAGFLPQFIRPGPAFLATAALYGLAHAAMGMAWLGLVALGAHQVRGRVTRPGFRMATEAACGLALLGFAARLAL
ncbi:MAG TPA: LysE family translocator [Candidatus Thermoplasmatota archaeon]|nr:LysE family translocator [Candidatus Thermoplasmatota archaeon]